MDIKNVTANVNTANSVNATSAANEKIKVSFVKKQEKTNDTAVVSDDVSKKKGIVSDTELAAILENISSAESRVSDVDKADEMIRKANANILAAKEDSIKAQANQTKDVVEKLTN